ncbi:MAG: hypothetical protein ACQEP9_10010 [Bacillota bacterium]
MKRLVLITLVLVLICSVSVSAENNFEISAGAIEGQNIEDFIPGAKVKLTTDELNYNDLYDLVELTSTFGVDDPNYSFISSDLMFYSRLGDLEADNRYFGLGVKHLFLDNSLASNFIFNSDITAYSVPLALKLEEDYGMYDIFFNGSAFKGLYGMTVPGDDARASFSGYDIDLGIKFNLEQLDLQLSYKQENYSFAGDSDIIGAEDFDDDYRGLFAGLYF